MFQKLFWAHVISLVGSGLSSVALALLAHQLVGASAAAGQTAWIFFGILAVVSAPVWILKARGKSAPLLSEDGAHGHTHSAFDPPGDLHSHEHRHGTLVHSHPHRHDQPHTHE